MDKYYFISSPHPNHHILNYTLQQVLPFSVKKRKEKKKHLNSFLFLSINHKLYQSHLHERASSYPLLRPLYSYVKFHFHFWVLKQVKCFPVLSLGSTKSYFCSCKPRTPPKCYLDLSIKCRPFVSLPVLPTHVMSGSEIHTVF